MSSPMQIMEMKDQRSEPIPLVALSLDPDNACRTYSPQDLCGKAHGLCSTSPRGMRR